MIGQVPPDAHSNHFGGMYNTTPLNTKIDLRFAVKELIRSAGKSVKNVLQPDILVDLSKGQEGVIEQVVK